jgi:23S rRNA (guanosine2251-2'-O)-methyltransferase
MASSRKSGFQRKTGRNSQQSGDSSDSKGGRPKKAYGMRQHGATARPKSPKSRHKSDSPVSSKKPRRPGSGREGGAGWIWGTHAALAALSNPRRTIHEILITEGALGRIQLPKGTPPPTTVIPSALSKLVGAETAHQGIAVKAAPLEWPDLELMADSDFEDTDGNGIILVLDQITDPHNVGAMLRLCSAFGVTALVMQTRKAPPLSGALAKVAVGCLETVPVCLETNISTTLQNLQRIGWMVTGLAGETDLSISKAVSGGGRHVIVMGAEGPGLRERVRKTCDQLAKIPMVSRNVPGQAESLNVATAAGIALYEARRE